MAQKIITIYTDDLTGKEAKEAKTHTMALDGIGYEIDLAPKSHEKLLEAMRPFMEAGRRVKGNRGPAKSSGKTGSAGETAKIRAWAKEQGYNVNERGRIPQDIQEAYSKSR